MPARRERPAGSGQGGQDGRIKSAGYLIGALLSVLVLQGLGSLLVRDQAIPYSEFDRLVAAGRVAEVTVGPNSIEGRFKTPQKPGGDRFVTERVDPALADRLNNAKRRMNADVEDAHIIQPAALPEPEPEPEPEFEPAVYPAVPSEPVSVASTPTQESDDELWK